MPTKNKQQILDAIIECNILRLKTNEALEYIKKQTKTKISERTFRRYKKELQDGVNNRLEHMIKSELVFENIQSIDLLKKVIQEHWINYNASKSIKEKKSILDSITKVQYDLISFYNNTTVVKNVNRWFDDKLSEINEKNKLAKNNSKLLTTYAN